MNNIQIVFLSIIVGLFATGGIFIRVSHTDLLIGETIAFCSLPEDSSEYVGIIVFEEHGYYVISGHTMTATGMKVPLLAGFEKSDCVVGNGEEALYKKKILQRKLLDN